MKTKAGNIGAVLIRQLYRISNGHHCKMDKVKLETLHTCN